MHSLKTLTSAANRDLSEVSDIGLLSMEGNLRNSIEMIIEKKNNGNKLLDKVDDKLEAKLVDIMNMIDESGSMFDMSKRNELAIELNKVIEMFKKDSYLNKQRSIKDNDPTNITDFTRLYMDMLQAASKLVGYEYVSETSYEEASMDIMKRGAIQHNMIENTGGFTSKTLNIYTEALQRYTITLKTTMYSDVELIRDAVNELKRDKDYNWIKERTVGQQASIYENLWMFTGDNLVMKDPEDMSNNLTPAERKFLRLFLKKICEARHIDKTHPKALWLPLKRSSDNTDTIGQKCDRMKDRINEIKQTSVSEMLKNLCSIDDNTVITAGDRNRANGDIYVASNFYSSTDIHSTIENRSAYINKQGSSFFSTDFEDLFLSFVFESKREEAMNKILPIAEAATFSAMCDEMYSNNDFSKEVDFIEEHIRAKIHRQNIQEEYSQKPMKYVNKVKSLMSNFALAYNINQLTYQTLQGLFLNGLAMAKKNSISCNFTKDDLAFAIPVVYGSAFKSNSQKTLIELLNDKYGLNAISTTDYARDMTSNRNGIMNAGGKLARKWAERPDLYNRMTLFIAQLHHDGIIDSYKVVNNHLVYDFKKDKRFQTLIKGDKSNPKYNEELSEYIALAREFTLNGTLNPDGTPFNYVFGGPIIPLPDALTDRNVASLKDVGDAIYGYYDDTSKALFANYAIGSLFFHFRTYWTAKKNQYLAPGGVKLRGQYQQVTKLVVEGGKQIEKKLWYKKGENGELTTEITDNEDEAAAPYKAWVGEYQEGILATLVTLYRETTKNGDPLYFLKQYNKFRHNQMRTDEKQIFIAQLANIKQLLFDLSMWGFGAMLTAGMGGFFKDLLKDSDTTSFDDAIILDAFGIMQHTTRNAFSDFNAIDTILSPFTSDIDPVAIGMLSNHLRNMSNLLTGDTDLIEYLVNTTSASRNFGYTLNLLKPDYANEEGGLFVPVKSINKSIDEFLFGE